MLVGYKIWIVIPDVFYDGSIENFMEYIRDPYMEVCALIFDNEMVRNIDKLTEKDLVTSRYHVYLSRPEYKMPKNDGVISIMFHQMFQTFLESLSDGQAYEDIKNHLIEGIKNRADKLNNGRSVLSMLECTTKIANMQEPEYMELPFIELCEDGKRGSIRMYIGDPNGRNRSTELTGNICQLYIPKNHRGGYSNAI